MDHHEPLLLSGPPALVRTCPKRVNHEEDDETLPTNQWSSQLRGRSAATRWTWPHAWRRQLRIVFGQQSGP